MFAGRDEWRPAESMARWFPALLKSRALSQLIV
jgi:hypothetical protein